MMAVFVAHFIFVLDISPPMKTVITECTFKNKPKSAQINLLWQLEICLYEHQIKTKLSGINYEIHHSF